MLGVTPFFTNKTMLNTTYIKILLFKLRTKVSVIFNDTFVIIAVMAYVFFLFSLLPHDIINILYHNDLTITALACERSEGRSLIGFSNNRKAGRVSFPRNS